MEGSKSIGIKEIATMAKVSVGTVDRVLHNRGRVSEATKEKIERLLSEHGYRYKKSILHTYAIGILLPSPSINPYWALPLKGLLDQAKEFKGSLIKVEEFLFDYNSPSDYLAKSEELVSKDIDGIIIHPLFRQETYQIIRKVRERNIPFAFLDVNIPELEPTFFVCQDAKNCGGLAGRLISLGIHQDDQIWIINLSSQNDHSTTYLREIGAINTLKTYISSPQQIHVLDIDPNINNEEMLTIFKSNIDKHKTPSRIYVTNSKISRIYNVFQKLKIEDRVIMIGHDPLEENIDLLNNDKIDFLITQDSKKQGALVLKRLHDYLVYKKLDQKETHICSNVYSKENINTLSDF
ncbi:substrate-binding domain-containing protein [Flammeovirga sp. MY04]|uniref:LacI family DNA-binding transcriptional regulator n=1 Tax=Flammeovirga sp. MY04 TaxID=1191459 RepID=UPI0008062A9F|nr:LacI family DNA-binding transcriptional regulator [Flammeovirga sp. MY04]ANQ50844.1 substrate-binding domain-containing protein [Flammeovirga sp. MY04]